jgi:hypothetical protein
MEKSGTVAIEHTSCGSAVIDAGGGVRAWRREFGRTQIKGDFSKVDDLSLRRHATAIVRIGNNSIDSNILLRKRSGSFSSWANRANWVGLSSREHACRADRADTV